MKRLLDTNAYSAWKRGDARILAIVRDSERLLCSAIVVGELLFGFRFGSRADQNERELRDFLTRPDVSFLSVSTVTSDRFARLALALRRRGTPIPSNDIWIAAHALEFGADLVTLDRHFDTIDGLAVIHPS